MRNFVNAIATHLKFDRVPIAISTLILALLTKLAATIMLTLAVVQPVNAHYNPLGITMLALVFCTSLVLTAFSVRYLINAAFDNGYDVGGPDALSNVSAVVKSHSRLRAAIAQYGDMLDNGPPEVLPPKTKPRVVSTRTEGGVTRSTMQEQEPLQVRAE